MGNLVDVYAVFVGVVSQKGRLAGHPMLSRWPPPSTSPKQEIQPIASPKNSSDSKMIGFSCFVFNNFFSFKPLVFSWPSPAGYVSVSIQNIYF